MPLKRGQRYSLPKLSSAAHILTLLVLLNWILLGVSGAGAALLQDDKRAVDHPVFTQKKCFVYTDHKPLVFFYSKYSIQIREVVAPCAGFSRKTERM